VSVMSWLLEGDPAIRWQVMRDFINERVEVVAAERARVALEGWGAKVLELQTPSGYWGGDDESRTWMTTTYEQTVLVPHDNLRPWGPAGARESAWKPQLRLHRPVLAGSTTCSAVACLDR
jgi:hypothetical protein